MGLDAIEIIMKVEETFGIIIEDRDVDKMSAPRDLIDLVMNKVGQADAAGCLTHRAFNLLRASLMRQLSLKRRDIAPHARMAALVPRTQRKVLLERLAAELGTHPFPALVRPKWLVDCLVVCSTALGITVAFFIIPPGLWEHRGALFLTAIGVAAMTGFLAGVATSACRFDFPPQLATAGDVSLWLMAHKTDLTPSAPGKWTREQVAARVREIVVEQLDCAPTYREDASFVEDLGMG